MIDLKYLFDGEWVDISHVKEVIEKAFQTKVIDESLIDGIPEEIWTEARIDEPRQVRFRFRVKRQYNEPSSEDKILIYGTLALISEEWGQGCCPDVKWGIKFVKDGKYTTELDYNQIEFQVYFHLSYGSN